MQQRPARIIVIGGGFAGIAAVRNLYYWLSPKEFEVTLFDRRPHFVFTPLLPEVAVGSLHHADVVTPFTAFFPKGNFHFVQQAVERIDFEKQEVTAAGAKHHYDHIIIAPGAHTNFYGSKEFQQHALELKDYDDALRVRKRLRELAESGKREPRVIVVGGGPTGVEFAIGAMKFLRHVCERSGRAPNVTVVQSAPKIIPQGDDVIRDYAMQRLRQKDVQVLTDAKVIAIDATHAEIAHNADGKREELSYDLILWAAGIAPNTIPVQQGQNSDALDKSGRYQVDACLRVIGTKNAYALGDAACYAPSAGKEPLPALAQVAIRQGPYAAKAIALSMNGKGERIKPFAFTIQGFLISLGKHDAVGRINGFHIKGLPAWLLWRTIYVMKSFGARHKTQLAGAYTRRLFHAYH